MFAYNRSLYINEDIVMGHEKWVIPSREAASHTHMVSFHIQRVARIIPLHPQGNK